MPKPNTGKSCSKYGSMEERCPVFSSDRDCTQSHSLNGHAESLRGDGRKVGTQKLGHKSLNPACDHTPSIPVGWSIPSLFSPSSLQQNTGFINSFNSGGSNCIPKPHLKCSKSTIYGHPIILMMMVVLEWACNPV